MMKIVIIGTSGHAKVIIDIIEQQGIYEIYGLLDSYKEKGTLLFGYTILGTEEYIEELRISQNIQGCFIAIGDNSTRKKMARNITKKNPSLQFINAIHPSSIIGKNVVLGNGNVIMPGVVINSDSVIGDFCILNTMSSLGHDGIMGDFSSISSGVNAGGNLKLMESSAISIGATTIENITIGKESIIGAGAVVTTNIPNNVIAYGIPAKVIRKRTSNDTYLSGGKKK